MGRCFKHFNIRSRRKLSEMLIKGASIEDISLALGFSKQSIYREIKRARYIHTNHDYTYEERYNPEYAQELADMNLRAKGGNLKIDKDIKLANFIEEMIVEKKYSPEATLLYIKSNNLKFDVEIKSVNTIYSYIDKGVFYRLERKHLPRRKKYKPTKRIIRKDDDRARKNRPKELSIEKREDNINDRASFGHWEMDCVIGKRNNKKTLLVLTERYTRYEIIQVIKRKTSKEVAKALNRIEKSFGSLFYKVFKSITVDNGAEFVKYDIIKKALRRKGDRFKLYYCHPYSSYERGSNENANILIRRFLPKGSDFDSVLTNKLVKSIEEWMNNYPRKILKGLSAGYLFKLQLENL